MSPRSPSFRAKINKIDEFTGFNEKKDLDDFNQIGV